MRWYAQNMNEIQNEYEILMAYQYGDINGILAIRYPNMIKQDLNEEYEQGTNMEYEWDMNMEYDRDTDGIYIYT